MISLNLNKVHIFREEITVTPFLHMRYDRTDCALMCTAVTNAIVSLEYNLENLKCQALLAYSMLS